MPSLDLSDAYLEPSFLDTITVVRRAQNNDTNGRVQTTNAYFSTYANIDAASPDQLERLPEQEYQGKTLSIVTKFRLRGASAQGTQSYQPDIILYEGDSYVVSLIDDYSRYGPGWIQAIATSTNWVDQAPQGNNGSPSARFNLPANSEYLPCFS